jgi:glycine hydroxymethyltransferase
MRNMVAIADAHDEYMQDRIDLIASNTYVSRCVKQALSSSLTNNYTPGTPGNRLFPGCAYIDLLEREVTSLARQLFGMPRIHAEFLSGTQANMGAYHALLRPGDTVVSAATRHGGHYSHTEQGPLRWFHARVIPATFDSAAYNLDIDALDKLFADEHPRLLIVGWSEFLFPYPLPILRVVCDRYGVTLMYDMSHAAGLIAGGVFQPDLAEYADVVTSSTGKSLHAPDHGLVMFKDEALEGPLREAVMPLLTSNTHPQELGALGVALAEANAFGGEYAGQVVRNAQALGAALSARGVAALYGHCGYTQSHMVLVECASSHMAVALLERAGILCNACELPWDEAGQPTGLRLGTQVLTRRGLREAEMARIAEVIARVLVHANEPVSLWYEIIRPLAQQFSEAAFTFDEHLPVDLPAIMRRTLSAKPNDKVKRASTDAALGRESSS